MSLVAHKIEILTLPQAAALSPYSADYLNLLVRKKKIKATKIGRDWLITKSDLFNYVRKQHTESLGRVKHLGKYLHLLNDV